MDIINGYTNCKGAVKGSFVFLLLIAVDQLTKNWAANIFQNHNFAFSLPMPLYVMYGIYFIGIAAIAVYLFKHQQNLSKIDFFSWMMILAGAMSNVGERVVLGYVRDWIYIKNGIFNIADGYIILGVVILLINSLMTKTTKMTKLT